MTMPAIEGCLMGTAVGDALGLPYEGISRHRAARLLGPAVRHRFLFGHGMVSDDTDHSLLVAESLIASAGNLDRFDQELARRLRRWFLSLPAGIGLATVRACGKLLVGISPRNSGVFSAGNGPAMRSALLGLFARDDQQLVELVQRNTRITHTDPKAEMGAFTIALAACFAAGNPAPNADDYLDRLRSALVSAHPTKATEFLHLIEQAAASARAGQSPTEFADSLGLSRGVGGYVFHGVPVVIQAWLARPDDFESALQAIIACGGDADTNAAMLGGILGASVGVEGIPLAWRNRLILFPYSEQSIGTVARQLHHVRESGTPEKPTSPLWLLTLAKNLPFLAIVLFHGFRRLAPPY